MVVLKRTGVLYVLWRPEARQGWFAKPLVSIGTSFTAPGSW